MVGFGTIVWVGVLLISRQKTREFVRENTVGFSTFCVAKCVCVFNPPPPPPTDKPLLFEGPNLDTIWPLPPPLLLPERNLFPLELAMGGGGLTTQGVSQGGLFPQGALTPEGGLFPQGDAEANRARVVQPLGDLGTSPAELVSSEQDKNLVSSVGLPASAGFCLGLGAVSLLSLSFCPPPTPAPRPPNIHTHSRSRSLSLTHTHTPVFVFLEFDLR